MTDKVKEKSFERKVALLQNIQRQHQENLTACEQAYQGTPYFDECKKAAARTMLEQMLETLKK